MGASADAETGSQATPEAPAGFDPARVEGEYRMNPQFRRFLEIVGSIERAMLAWDIAKEAFDPTPDDVEFEVWQGELMVAGSSGPMDRALGEAVHYAVVYQTDAEPCVIKEVRRRDLSPDDAHDRLERAAAKLEGDPGSARKGDSAGPKDIAQGDSQ